MKGPIGKSQMLGVGFETGHLLFQAPLGDFLQPLDGIASFRSEAMTRPFVPMRGWIKSARSAVPDPTSSARPFMVTGT